MRYFLLASFFLAACTRPSSDKLTMIQITDRHNMSETISIKEKLAKYEGVDFMASQPYQRVMRLYAKDQLGKQKSILTSYHENGLIKEYLEATSSRAFGVYKEWYPSGKLKISAKVIEGIADLSTSAKQSWLFDGVSYAYEEDGILKAEFCYANGKLEGNTIYYYPSGQIEKLLRYHNGELSGESMHYSKDGEVLGFSFYNNGKRDGATIFYGNKDIPAFEERYENGRLVKGQYVDFKGNIQSCIQDGYGFQSIFEEGKLYKKIEYREGMPCGLVEIFSSSQKLLNSYSMLEGKKHGEEWVYYPHLNSTPKLLISWYEDEIHGIVKTWYESGKLESQREMAHNQRQGICSAWYESGERMFVEEYENDRLISGQYYKKGSIPSVSFIDNGMGVATLYDKDGIFLRKVFYKNSEIVQK